MRVRWQHNQQPKKESFMPARLEIYSDRMWILLKIYVQESKWLHFVLELDMRLDRVGYHFARILERKEESLLLAAFVEHDNVTIEWCIYISEVLRLGNVNDREYWKLRTLHNAPKVLERATILRHSISIKKRLSLRNDSSPIRHFFRVCCADCFSEYANKGRTFRVSQRRRKHESSYIIQSNAFMLWLIRQKWCFVNCDSCLLCYLTQLNRQEWVKKDFPLNIHRKDERWGLLGKKCFLGIMEFIHCIEFFLIWFYICTTEEPYVNWLQANVNRRIKLELSIWCSWTK